MNSTFLGRLPSILGNAVLCGAAWWIKQQNQHSTWSTVLLLAIYLRAAQQCADRARVP